MARSLLIELVKDRAGNCIANAKVNVFLAGTSTPVSDMYTVASGGTPTTFLVSDSNGYVYGWFDTPKMLALEVSDNAGAAYYAGDPTTLVPFPTLTLNHIPVYENPADGEADDATLATLVASVAAKPSHFVVANLAARDALSTMNDGDLCIVENIERTYRYDEDNTEWRPLDYDSGEVNVLDYGAHWSNTDNGPYFQAAIDDTREGGGTRDANTIVIPQPVRSGGNQQAYAFTTSINLREIDGLKFVGRAGNVRAGFSHQSMVELINTTNSNPIIDSDNDAVGAGLTGVGSTTVTFENLMMYNAAATPVNLSHCVQWVWRRCTLITFADTNTYRAQNCFWHYFDDCSFVNGSTGTTGILYYEGQAPQINAVDTYLMRHRNCRFSGGPMMEYHFNSNSSGSAPRNFSFIDCDTENQSGTAGMFVRTTKEAAVTSNDIGDIRLEGCTAYDPTSGSSPWVVINNAATLAMLHITYDNSGCAQAGLSRLQSGVANVTGVYQRGGQFLQVTDNSGNHLSTVRGEHHQYRSGGLFTGDASAGSATLSLPVTDGNGPSQHLYAVRGNSAASLAVCFDGYLLWGSGSSSTPDTNLYRSAADTLRTDDSLIVGATFRHLGASLGFFGDTPVARPAGSTDVVAGLVSLGLRSATSNPPLNLGTGAVTAGLVSASDNVTLTANNKFLRVTRSDAATFAALGLNSSNVLVLQTTGDAISISNGTGGLSLTVGTVTFADANNMAFNTSTGTKIGTATGQKIGFWNATPVAQQVLATGAGATVDNVISLLQTLGLCRQT